MKGVPPASLILSKTCVAERDDAGTRLNVQPVFYIWRIGHLNAVGGEYFGEIWSEKVGERIRCDLLFF